MQVDELLPYLKEHQTELVEQIRGGKYKPNPVRRVETPKEEKGKFRKLGVPTVVDRELERKGHKFVRYADDCMKWTDLDVHLCQPTI
ncbi:hypothetical protein C806_01903 [Lachnospiraceae bacterium 3-1]|nr:hypothetical protein C806_01903 [Lachnospiraceae bacterium 3-1]